MALLNNPASFIVPINASMPAQITVMPTNTTTATTPVPISAASGMPATSADATQ